MFLYIHIFCFVCHLLFCSFQRPHYMKTLQNKPPQNAVTGQLVAVFCALLFAKPMIVRTMPSVTAATTARDGT